MSRRRGSSGRESEEETMHEIQCEYRRCTLLNQSRITRIDADLRRYPIARRLIPRYAAWHGCRRGRWDSCVLEFGREVRERLYRYQSCQFISKANLARGIREVSVSSRGSKAIGPVDSDDFRGSLSCRQSGHMGTRMAE